MHRNRFTCHWINKSWAHFHIISSFLTTLFLMLVNYSFTVVLWDHFYPAQHLQWACWVFSYLLCHECYNLHFGKGSRCTGSSCWYPEMKRLQGQEKVVFRVQGLGLVLFFPMLTWTDIKWFTPLSRTWFSFLQLFPVKGFQMAGDRQELPEKALATPNSMHIS